MNGTPAKRRRPVWLPVAAMLLILPVLLYLGLWQLDRAAQKRAMFDRFADDPAPAALAGLLDQPPEAVRYRPVSVEGRFWSARQFLLEGMTREGLPGLHVLTPLRVADGSVVLVDRGWIPETRTRDIVPDLSVAENPRSLTGRVVPYPEPGLRLATDEPVTTWPRRVIYPTPGEIETALGAPVHPHMIWLDAGADDGFVREWKPAEFGPARHIGYAVQWFGLAVTLVLIYIVMKFRRRDD